VTLPRVRFLHTADWQLGMRRHFLDSDAQPRFVAARIEAIRTIGRIARENDCAFVVVAGDVFESNQIDRATRERSVEALREIELPVYLLPGNHDPLDAATIFTPKNFERAPNVHLLTDTTPVEAAPGVDIVGVPWDSKRPLRDLVGDAVGTLEAVSGRARIVVGHGIVESLSANRDDPAQIRLEPLRAALADGRIHFVALGDRHSATKVEQGIWYSGAPEPTDFNELDSGRVLVVELDGGQTRVEPHETGTWSFLLKEAELDGAEQVEQLAGELDAVPRKDTTIVKLGLRGGLPLRAMARLEDLLNEAELKFAAVTRSKSRSDLVLLPDEFDLDELGLSGFARTAAQKLAERRDDPTAADALALLYRLAGGATE